MIQPSNTLHRGYIVLDKENKNINTKNINLIMSILSSLEKRNYIADKNLVDALFFAKKETLSSILSQIKETDLPRGRFLRKSFAVDEKVKNDNFTVEDLMQQLYVYSMTYGLGITPDDFKLKKRKNVSKKNGVEINKNVKTITVKTTEEFKEDLKNIIYIPVVFGAEQINIIRNAFEENLLFDILTEPMKIKENMFSIFNIVGKENIKKVGLLKTANDVLRYAFYVSSKDWRNLSFARYEDKKFKLSTSDKKNIMNALNNLPLSSAFSDMYPKRKLWYRLAINLHPNSSKFSKYPKAQKLFNWLRNGGYEKEVGKTFNQVKEELIKQKDYVGLFNHLSTNAGYLMRNIDFILRNSSKKEIEQIVSIMKEDSFQDKLNPKLILSVKSFLKFRKKNNFEDRYINVKGKIYLLDDKPLKSLKTWQVKPVIKVFKDIMLNHLKGKELFAKENI